MCKSCIKRDELNKIPNYTSIKLKIPDEDTKTEILCNIHTAFPLFLKTAGLGY